jgi:Heterokaryon incompatibility protein (HET)
MTQALRHDVATWPHFISHLTESSGRKIRVLDLDPAPFSSPDPIHGALREIPLDGSQLYEALSYVWGTDEPSNPVHLGSESLLVRDNCYAALRRLRDRACRRTLWIDAICINQEDIKEKSLQVALMADIYSNADRVYI